MEGTILRRNKPDTTGKHPWKAEATEGDTGLKATVITGWYTKVYEPTTTALTTQQQSQEEASGDVS